MRNYRLTSAFPPYIILIVLIHIIQIFNTIQKSYALLEKEGILYSVAGKGDFVADNAMRIKEMRKEEIREMFVKATREARQSGLWIDEIFTIVDEAYSSN